MAVENGSVPYKNINKILTLIQQHAKSPYTGLVAKIESENEDLSMTDIQLSIVHNGNLISKTSANEQGLVNFKLLEADVGNDAKIVINQPKGSVSMSLSAGIKKIDSLQVPYVELFSVLNDLEEIANEMIGLPGWMLPDFDYLIFCFDSDSNITLTGEKFLEVYDTDTEHRIKIARNEDIKESNLTIIFSQLPKEVKFYE